MSVVFVSVVFVSVVFVSVVTDVSRRVTYCLMCLSVIRECLCLMCLGVRRTV